MSWPDPPLGKPSPVACTAPTIASAPNPVPFSSGVCRFSVINLTKCIRTFSCSNHSLMMSRPLLSDMSNNSFPSTLWLSIEIMGPKGTAGENNAPSSSGWTCNAMRQKRRYASASWRENWAIDCAVASTLR